LHFSIPTIVDGSPNKGLKELFNINSDKIIFHPGIIARIINKYFNNTRLKFEGATGDALYHHHRTLADGQLLFSVNSGLSTQ